MAETSTRSSPLERAMRMASCGAMMPSWAPVSSMTRTSRTRIRSLIRTRSSRRGGLPLSNAITTSPSAVLPAGHRRGRPRRHGRRGPRPGGCERRPVPSAASRSPSTSMYGICWSWASRILYPIFSTRASSVTRRPPASSVADDGLGGVQVAVRQRQHRRLHGRQPHRERAGVVLDQQRHEPLEAAEDGAVDDHRPVLGVVRARVLQVEALRHLVVELDRRALPLAADGVGDVEVDLRAVEGAVALVDRVGLAGRSRARASARPRRGPRSRSRRGTRPAASTA